MENSPRSATSQQPRTYYPSYSHRDSALVQRLHREMEQYRVSQRLLGKPSPVRGVIPRCLQPIFLDREMPKFSEPEHAHPGTLNHSYTLIAACSPYSAVSHWVNGEVQYFKQIGKADRVMCVILYGEPNATDEPCASSHRMRFLQLRCLWVTPKSASTQASRGPPSLADFARQNKYLTTNLPKI